MPSSLEDFQKVVSSLAKLIEDGPVALRILRPYTPYSIDFDIHFRDKAVVAALDESGLSRKEFRDIVEEAEEVLASLIQGSPLSRGEDEGEDEQLTEEKMKSLRASFDIEELNKRSWIKANAKSDVLLSSGWDVSLKLVDEAQLPPDDKPVVTGLLTIKGSRVQSPFAIFGVESTELLLTTDRADVKAMMQTLRRLDEALAAAEQDGNSSE
jgi:hypothetical protein